jgi:hypothetical protein
MTARLKKTAGSVCLVLLAVGAACTSYTEIPIETPISPKLDVSAFQRIFIAGFIAGANEMSMPTWKRFAAAQPVAQQGHHARDRRRHAAALEVAKQNGGGHTPPVPDQQAVAPSAGSGQGRSSTTRRILSPTAHLRERRVRKRIGEEYQQPLIVTGAVLFAPQQRSASCSASRKVYDSFGRRVVVPVAPTWSARACPAPDLHLHRRPDRRNPAQRDVPGRDSLQRQPADPGPVVLFRAHGSAPAGLP